MRFVLLVLLTACAACAGEYALLANGGRLHVDRHELNGTHIKLYKDSGYIELAANSVTGFAVEEPAPAPVPPAPEPVAAFIALPPPSPTELADAAADKYHLPRTLVRSVMAAESGFQQNVVSPKGAIGLMQLMPETARQFGIDPNDPAQNVDAGVHYLSDLLTRYHNGLFSALAAYNAGPGAVEKYHSIPPYRETIDYVSRIYNSFQASEAAASKTPRP